MIIPILYNQDKGKAQHGEILKEIVKGVESEAIIPLIHKEIFPFERVFFKLLCHIFQDGDFFSKEKTPIFK